MFMIFQGPLSRRRREKEATQLKSTSKNKQSTSTKIVFFLVLDRCFFLPHAARAKKLQKYLPGALPRASGELPGTLKSINFSPLGGPGAQPMIFLGPPGRHQEPFGALLAPTLGPHGSQKCPGGLQAFIFDPPGALRGAFLLNF